MKIALLISILALYGLAQMQYEKGKIDMHGGKETSYSGMGNYQSAGFGNRSMGGMSAFLDTNASKRAQTKHSGKSVESAK